MKKFILGLGTGFLLFGALDVYYLGTVDVEKVLRRYEKCKETVNRRKQ